MLTKIRMWLPWNRRKHIRVCNVLAGRTCETCHDYRNFTMVQYRGLVDGKICFVGLRWHWLFTDVNYKPLPSANTCHRWRKGYPR